MSSFTALKDKRASRRPRAVPDAEERSLPSGSPTVKPETKPDSPQTSTPTSNDPSPDFPPYLEIRTSPTAGRGVFLRPSSSPLKKGTTIVETAPLSAVLSTRELSGYCSTCFLGPHELAVQAASASIPTAGSDALVARKGLLTCGGCRVIRYCSKACQSLGWSAHQTECRALIRLHALYTANPAATSESENERPWIPEEAVRALARVCWERRRRRREGELKERGYWAPIEGLQSHRAQLSSVQREPFAKLAMHLAQYLAAGDRPPNEEGALRAVDMREFGFRGVQELMDVVCAFATNAFTLSTPSLAPVGVAISPSVAMFNHSCAPNAVVVFPEGCGVASAGKGMRVVLIEDILPGQEILTSYIDVSLPRHIRRRDLEERYHFTCVCPLCATERVDPRWCVYHVGCAKAGVVAMPDLEHSEGNVHCAACREEARVDLPRVRTLVQLAEGIIDADQRGELGASFLFVGLMITDGGGVDPIKAERVPSLVEALLTVQPATSYPLLPLLRIYALQLTTPPTSTAIVSRSSEAEQTLPRIFDAIRVQTILVNALDGVLPTFHPSQGIALAELGKLLNVHVDDGPEVPLGNGVTIPRATAKRVGLALAAVRKALEVLQVGFGGPGGLVGVEMGWLVGGLEKEVQMQIRGGR